jgi:hypothetical protein
MKCSVIVECRAIKSKEGLFSGFTVFSKECTYPTEHVLNVSNPLKRDRKEESALITKVSKNICKVELTFWHPNFTFKF